MSNYKILTQDEVFKHGLEFDGDIICFSGEYGQQVYNKSMEEGGEAVNGLVYEKNRNEGLAYYCFYKNGISNGQNVEFYDTGEVKSHCLMERGTINGELIEFYKNGNTYKISNCKNGRKISYKEFDEGGNVVVEKTLSEA